MSALCLVSAASSTKDERDAQQGHSNRNGSISEFKDGEIQADLRDLEPDEMVVLQKRVRNGKLGLILRVVRNS